MYKFFILILFTVCLVQCTTKRPSTPEQLTSDSTNHAPVVTTASYFNSFGTNNHKFNVRKLKVQENGSFYAIMAKLNFTPTQIYRIAHKANPIINFGAFRPGQRIRAYFSKKDHSLEKLIWQPNKLLFVTFSWVGDSLRVYRASRIETNRTHTAVGTIETSLYDAISDDQSRDELVYSLTSILAWEIDFTTLRKGDSFRILYNKAYVDGKYFDTGQVLAIKLKHLGETYFAYYFNNGKIDGYYDENGNSVQKALLKIPFKYDHRITSGFNMHRMNPVLHRVMPHTGVDYAAPIGTPVLATGAGVILEAHYGGAAGNIIKIRHNSTFVTAYMHLSSFADGIHKGMHVDQGEVIGYSGATGRVTGPNLHYSIYKNGNAVNPLTLNLPRQNQFRKSIWQLSEKIKGG